MKKDSKYAKVTTAIAIAASVVVAAVPVTTEASTFKDIQPSQYFYNDVLNLHERGIISGFSDGTFKPSNSLTRGQAAKIIAGVLKLDTTNVVNPNFKDIPTTHQYYGAIAALKQAGIIDGYEDGTFRQGANIERNHVAKILAGAMNLQASNPDALPFQDVRAEYKNAIAALHELNITTGKTPTTFDGNSNVTRGQMAAFVARAEKALAQILPAPVGQSVTFTVDDYSTAGISIDGTPYTYSTEVVSIFTDNNKAALKGASLTATVNNGVITKVNNITLKTNGTAAQPVAFAANASIDGLTVSVDYLVVTGLTVSGNATLTQKVANSVEFNNVKIVGDLIADSSIVGTVASLNSLVANTTAGPKVKLTNTTVGKFQVKSNGITIETTGAIPEVVVASNVAKLTINGPVTKLTVQSATSFELLGTTQITDLVVTTAVPVVLNHTGTVTALTVQNGATSITVGPNARITTLVIPAGTTAQSIISNYAQVAQQIGKVVIGAAVVTPTNPTSPGITTPDSGGVIATPDTGGVTPSTPDSGTVTTPSTASVTMQNKLRFTFASPTVLAATTANSKLFARKLKDDYVIRFEVAKLN